MAPAVFGLPSFADVILSIPRQNPVPDLLPSPPFQLMSDHSDEADLGKSYPGPVFPPVKMPLPQASSLK